MTAEWANHPPVHHLVASYLGHKPPAAQDVDSRDVMRGEKAATELSSMLPVARATPIDDSLWNQRNDHG